MWVNLKDIVCEYMGDPSMYGPFDFMTGDCRPLREALADKHSWNKDYDFVNGTFYVKTDRAYRVIDRTYDPCRLHLQPVDNIENVVQRALEFRASPDYVRCDPATILFL